MGNISRSAMLAVSDTVPSQLEFSRKTNKATLSMFVKRLTDGVWLRQVQSGVMVGGRFEPTGAPTFTVLSEWRD